MKWSPSKAQDVLYASISSSSLSLLGTTNDTLPSVVIHLLRINDSRSIMCASSMRWRYICRDVNLCTLATLWMSPKMVFGAGNSKLYAVQYIAVELPCRNVVLKRRLCASI